MTSCSLEYLFAPGYMEVVSINDPLGGVFQIKMYIPLS